MRPASHEELRAASEGADAVLCDWDGCLAIDNRLQPGVADFLRKANRIAIISNNSTMTRALCRDRLAAEKIEVAPEDVHLAGSTLLEEAAATFMDRPVHLVSSPLMREEALRLGLFLTDRAPEAVLLLRDPRFDYAKLKRMANHIRAGAAFWIANPDFFHPSGIDVTPDTGALARAVEAVAGRPPDRIIGKPQPLLFTRALATLGLAPENALMIGDNPATDIAGAAAARIRAILVGSSTWRIAGAA